jgi:hypothetical protein
MLGSSFEDVLDKYSPNYAKIAQPAQRDTGEKDETHFETRNFYIGSDAGRSGLRHAHQRR